MTGIRRQPMLLIIIACAVLAGAALAATAPAVQAAETPRRGGVLLARGDIKGAVAQLKIAHKRSPHFADPLELWGEALLAKGDARAAERKFAQASEFAPRWGRLHLMWAKALAQAGRADEARAHRATAAGLDLTATERAQLNALRI